MSDKSRDTFPVCLFLGFALASTGAAQESWPQWRGPDRDGHVPASCVPATWPEALSPAWRLEVGEGHASPVVANDRAYALTRQGDEEVVTAVDLARGEVVWQRSYAVAIGINPYADAHGRWPRSTPLVHGDRLVTLGADATLSVWHTTSGELVWRHTRDHALDTSQLFCGTAASPIVDAGRILVHLGDDAQGELAAFRLEDGERAWTTRLEGPGYASPIRMEILGEPQCVTLTLSRVIGVDPRDGTVRWSRPFADTWNENIVTPIASGASVIVAGVRRGTYALTPRRGDGDVTVETTWSNREAEFYMSSPVLHDGVLYGFSKRRRGQLVALDAATGASLWSHDLEADNAAVLLAGTRLVILTTDGELRVGQAAREGWSEERRYALDDSGTWAHPVLLGDRLLIKGATHLAAWRISDTTPSDR